MQITKITVIGRKVLTFLFKWYILINLKCLWNEIFAFSFYSKILKSMILWFVIFEFGLRTSAYEFFLLLRSWRIRVKNVRHSARAEICKLVQWRHKVWKNLLAIMAAKRKKWRSGKFFVAGGPVLVSCKTPLTQKATSNLYFRQMKSEEHIAGDLLGYTGPTEKRRMHPCYVLYISKKGAIDGFWTVRIPCNGNDWITV